MISYFLLFVVMVYNPLTRFVDIRKKTFLDTNRYRIEVQYELIIEAKILFEAVWSLRDSAWGPEVPRLDIWM